jgi:hypothetical protein
VFGSSLSLERPAGRIPSGGAFLEARIFTLRGAISNRRLANAHGRACHGNDPTGRANIPEDSRSPLRGAPNIPLGRDHGQNGGTRRPVHDTNLDHSPGPPM